MDELDNEGWIDAAENPERSNAEIAALFSGASKADAPVIDLPPADLVTLPGGLVKGGEVIRNVTVRELNGEAEEALAKAALSQNFAHFLAVLIEHGTARIGDEPAKKNADNLKDMFIGDRDAIVLGIRRATYGNDVEIKDWTCPRCASQTNLTVTLDDIDTVTLGDPRQEATFKVRLRHGRVATVRLVTGKDQLAAHERPGLTEPEKDTVILSRCVTAITEASGIETVTAGLGGTIALGLSVPDRKAILRELVKRQPGPRYNSIKFTHQGCGEEVPLSLGLGDLFPDI